MGFNLTDFSLEQLFKISIQIDLLFDHTAQMTGTSSVLPLEWNQTPSLALKMEAVMMKSGTELIVLLAGRITWRQMLATTVTNAVIPE